MDRAPSPRPEAPGGLQRRDRASRRVVPRGGALDSRGDGAGARPPWRRRRARLGAGGRHPPALDGPLHLDRGPRSLRARSRDGRNLSLLAALQGTPSQLPLQDSVLFLEDVGEAPYRIDRMLTSLRSSGALRGVRAVVLGEFTRCDTRDDGVSVERVLRERLSTLGVPVLAGAPFGHGDHHRPWVQGAEVTVRRDGEVIFEEGLS
ncbi:MAG: hypothetical protein IPN17_18160 [Deltaproteobacteria bacterium]|nr:hypothetical protein [Deltaproteobacteria bacterium]